MGLGWTEREKWKDDKRERREWMGNPRLVGGED